MSEIKTMITSATFSHLWYVRDRLGSVRSVVDAAGTILQNTAYYASGVPVQCFGTRRVTDRGHIGNRYLDFAAIGWYDNTARMHDALLCRFTTRDPLAADYPALSPYTHCAANPLRYIDPDGRKVYADDWCIQGLLDGLSREEQQYIQFNDGLLDVEKIVSCETPSINLKALQALAVSKVSYIFKGTDSVPFKKGELMLSGTTDDDGTIGATLMPIDINNTIDGTQEYVSPDDNVYIYTSLNASKKNERQILLTKAMVTLIFMNYH